MRMYIDKTKRIQPNKHSKRKENSEKKKSTAENH